MRKNGWWHVIVLLIVTLTAGPARAQLDRGVDHITDVVYGHKLGVALTMDAFVPITFQSVRQKRIGVLWIVSAGWASRHDAIHGELAEFFTNRRQVIFEVIHGSQPKFTLPEIVEDIHRAVRFVRVHAKEYGVDPDRLAIAGASTGGHLALMMGSYGTAGDPNAIDPVDRASSAVQAVACFYPPTDFLNYGAAGKIGLKVPALKPFVPLFAIPADAINEVRDRRLRQLSPFYGISKATPPTLIIHGVEDMLVPIQQSERYITQLHQAGGEAQLEIRPGKGHSWPNMEPDMVHLADWFATHLAKPSPAEYRPKKPFLPDAFSADFYPFKNF